MGGVAAAQTQTPATGERPDALYPQPSGQDSAPKRSAPAPAAAARLRAPASAGTHAAPYRGNSGRKRANAAASTACSSARITKNGQLDCGTGGDAATRGKIVTK